MDCSFEEEFSRYDSEEKYNVLNESFIAFLNNLPDNFIDKEYVSIFFNRINFISEKRKNRIVEKTCTDKDLLFSSEEVDFQLTTFKNLIGIGNLLEEGYFLEKIELMNTRIEDYNKKNRNEKKDEKGHITYFINIKKKLEEINSEEESEEEGLDFFTDNHMSLTYFQKVFQALTKKSQKSKKVIIFGGDTIYRGLELEGGGKNIKKNIELHFYKSLSLFIMKVIITLYQNSQLKDAKSFSDLVWLEVFGNHDLDMIFQDIFLLNEVSVQDSIFLKDSKNILLKNNLKNDQDDDLIKKAIQLLQKNLKTVIPTEIVIYDDSNKIVYRISHSGATYLFNNNLNNCNKKVIVNEEDLIFTILYHSNKLNILYTIFFNNKNAFKKELTDKIAKMDFDFFEKKLVDLCKEIKRPKYYVHCWCDIFGQGMYKKNFIIEHQKGRFCIVRNINSFLELCNNMTLHNYDLSFKEKYKFLILHGHNHSEETMPLLLSQGKNSLIPCCFISNEKKKCAIVLYPPAFLDNGYIFTAYGFF